MPHPLILAMLCLLPPWPLGLILPPGIPSIGDYAVPSVDGQIAASGAPTSSVITIDFGTPVSCANTSGLVALEEDGVAHGSPLTYASSLSGATTMAVTIGGGSALDVGKCYTVTVAAATAGVTRDSDGATLNNESDLPVHLALDFREMEAATGVEVADLGLDDLGAVLANDGNARYVIRETDSGTMAFSDTVATTPTARDELKVMGSTEIAAYLASTNDTLMVRRIVSFDKGTADGTAVTSGRLFGSNPRMNWGYGGTFDAEGKYLGISYVGSDYNPGREPQVKWATEHVFDVVAVRNATDYDVRVLKDGRLIYEDSGLNLTDTEEIIAECQWENTLYDSGATVAWLNLHAVRVTAWRGGGFSNVPGLGQSPNGAVALPWWDETNSVVTLHNAVGQASSKDTAIDWSSVTGTIDLTTEHGSFDADRAFSERYRLTGPSGTATLATHARPRHTLPNGKAAVGIQIVFDDINRNGFDLRLTDEFGDRELGIRIDAGSSTTPLKILYDSGSDWSEVSTGIMIQRGRMYCVMLSCVENRSLGVTVSDYHETGNDADHGERARISEFSGLPSVKGGGSLVFDNDGVSETIDLFGPQIGVLAKLVESSYTASASVGNPNVNVNVARSCRRSYGADGGRGQPSSGYTPESRSAGPFNFLGRSGGKVSDAIDHYIGGEGEDWFTDAAAFPWHIIDGKVNQLGLNVERTGSTLEQAESDWDDHGADNIAAVLADELELIGYIRQGGAWFIIGATASPPVYYHATETFWIQEMYDANASINETRRLREAAGLYGGGYFFDHADYFGTEAAATSAAFATNNVHPGEGNASGRSDDYADGVYGSVELAVVASTSGSRARGRSSSRSRAPLIRR